MDELQEQLLLKIYEGLLSPTLKSEFREAFPGFFKRDTHRVGNTYKIEGESYILAQTEAFQIQLISLLNGNRFTGRISVQDTENVSDDELKRAACGHTYELTYSEELKQAYDLTFSEGEEAK